MKPSKLERQKIYYLLPLEWSLFYVMPSGEWRDFRERVKEASLNWEQCSCPNKCQANTLDELWEYDKRKHVKRFVRGQFICRGCHWLKSPTWRLETWKKDELGLLDTPIKNPHVFECLGKTMQQVRALRESDRAMHQKEKELRQRIERDLRTGEARIAYWTVDLSALKQYGYSEIEISCYGASMFAKARLRRPHRRNVERTKRY